MRVETLTVKMLRSGKRFSNDAIELTASLEEGDSWRLIERSLRIEAEKLIATHWRYLEGLERVEREEEEEKDRVRLAARFKEEDDRSIYVKTMKMTGHDPCKTCKVDTEKLCDWSDCDGCPADDGPANDGPANVDTDIPF